MLNCEVSASHSPLSWSIGVQWCSQGAQGPACGGLVTPTSPVEALWSPGHGSTPSPRQVTPPALPNLEVSPPQLGRCFSSQAVFCKDWRCPGSPRISSDSLLPGLHMDSGHGDLQGALSAHSILSSASVVVRFSKWSTDSVDSSLSVDRILVQVIPEHKCVHNMDYLRLVNVCMFVCLSQ